MSAAISIQDFNTPFGTLVLGSYNGMLCLCDWKYRKMRDALDQKLQKGLMANFIINETETIRNTNAQLNAYFRKEITAFNLPILMVGSDFQKKVWNALANIKYGETNTYLGLSQLLGNAKATRAVANANGANTISIIIPCHRIIGTNGSLVGYAGGLDTKEKLLKLERKAQESQLNFQF